MKSKLKKPIKKKKAARVTKKNYLDNPAEVDELEDLKLKPTMSKKVTITFTTQEEKDAAIAECKEKQLTKVACYETCLQELEDATINPDQQ